MRQFVTIASNAFMELVRQPVFLLLMTSSAPFEFFLAPPFYFAFGDAPTLSQALLHPLTVLRVRLPRPTALDPHGATHMFALGFFALALVLAYLLGGFSNFF